MLCRQKSNRLWWLAFDQMERVAHNHFGLPDQLIDWQSLRLEELLGLWVFKAIGTP